MPGTDAHTDAADTPAGAAATATSPEAATPASGTATSASSTTAGGGSPTDATPATASGATPATEASGDSGTAPDTAPGSGENGASAPAEKVRAALEPRTQAVIDRLAAVREVVAPPPSTGDHGATPLDKGPVVVSYDFGQFITIKVAGAGGQRLDAILHAGLDDPVALTGAASSSDATGTLAGALGGVPILDIVKGEGSVHLEPIKSISYNRSGPVSPFADGELLTQVTEDGTSRRYKFEVNDVAKAQLQAGQPATIVAYRAGDGGPQTPILLNVEPEMVVLKLDRAGIATVLATRRVTINTASVEVALGSVEIAALLAARPVVLTTREDPPRLVKIEDSSAAPATAPAAESFHVVDLPSFLEAPFVLNQEGAAMPVKLTGTQVQELLDGETQLNVAGQTVAIHRKASGPALPLTPGGVAPMAGGETVMFGSAMPANAGASAGMTALVPSVSPLSAINMYNWYLRPSIPSTLPPVTVSLYLPWVQTWTLVKTEEGRELSRLTLMPDQERTVETFTWDRTKKGLDRTSQMDSTQTFESSRSSKDTEDVVREMATGNEFQLSGGGGLSATVKGGYAEVTANGQINAGTKNSVANTARDTTNNLSESASKAAVTVTSRRISHVTESREFGSEDRTTHRIRNPNLCRTLTFVYRELLAAYRVETTLMRERAQLVALIENPLSVTKMDPSLVRRNETALRNALLDPALVDGFDALRMLGAYEAAQEIIRKQAAVMAAQAAATDPDTPTAQALAAQQAAQTALANAQTGANSTASGDGSSLTTTPDKTPPTAEEMAVAAVYDKLMQAAKLALESTLARANAVMKVFANHKRPDDAELQAARRFIFWKMLEGTASALTAAIATQSTTPPQNVKPKVEAAMTLISCAGDPMAKPGINDLTGAPDDRKEQLAIAALIKQSGEFKQEADWAWWSGTLRDHGLYSPDDCGIPSLLKQLIEAMRKFNQAQENAAATAGFGTPEGALNNANKAQDKSEAVDRLDQAFSLVDLANATERADALLSHMADHLDYYRFNLFQALPPTEQLDKIIEATGGNLPVGLFEPRVVAMNGSQLAVPLVTHANPGLQKWLEDLLSGLDGPPDGQSDAAAGAASGTPAGASAAASGADSTTPAPATTPTSSVRASLPPTDPAQPSDSTDKEPLPEEPLTYLPTPSIQVTMELGGCNGCEQFIEETRRIDLIEREAKALQSLAEALRRTERLVVGDLADPQRPADGVTLRLDDARMAAAATSRAALPAAGPSATSSGSGSGATTDGQPAQDGTGNTPTS